jgi:alkanesulfonate monooxygenase SsuD/methylene tetrahydromethanopterin reductase-like flavin-dependent oxidoreductase (luciferase family)
VRFGIFVAPFGPLAEPRRVAAFAAEAEEAGWDGVFLWDHLMYVEPVEEVADPWVTLAAVACATERVRMGPMVTPVARRRPAKLARETVTLDRLSGGRLVLGVGLGSERTGEFDRFGESVDRRSRAAALDDGLDLLAALWSGETVVHHGPAFTARDVRFRPGPLQHPRIPVWVASRWPNRAPLRRAARWDGWFPIELDAPEQLAEGLAEIRLLRAAAGRAGEPYDVAAEGEPGDDPGPWEAAGATWWLIGFGPEPAPDRIGRVVAAGPPRP